MAYPTAAGYAGMLICEKHASATVIHVMPLRELAVCHCNYGCSVLTKVLLYRGVAFICSPETPSHMGLCLQKWGRNKLPVESSQHPETSCSRKFVRLSQPQHSSERGSRTEVKGTG